MRPRQRKTLSFLSVGEQCRIERSCDFRLASAFPPKDECIPDFEKVRNLCKAATECARVLEKDASRVHEAENDAMAMIDDWLRTDEQLVEMASKVSEIQHEHSAEIEEHADRTIESINQLRTALTADAGARISRRCWECSQAAARLRFMRRHASGSSDEQHPVSCCICEARRVDTAFLPCGHCFCADCSEKAGNRCYMCRVEIQRTTRLYY